MKKKTKTKRTPKKKTEGYEPPPWPEEKVDQLARDLFLRDVKPTDSEAEVKNLFDLCYGVAYVFYECVEKVGGHVTGGPVDLVTSR